MCCTVLCCAVLYCAVMCCTVLCCAVMCCTVLWCTVLYYTVLCCTVLCCAVLYSAVLCCTVLYCTVLCCALLYCAVLYCTLNCKQITQELTKGKVVSVRAMMASSRRTGIAPLILNIGTGWWCVINFTPWPLYPRERTKVPTEKEAMWAPQTVCGFWKEKLLLLLRGFQPRAVKPVA